MYDPRIKKMAQVLVNYSLELSKNDKLVISGTSLASPLIQEVFREALRVGAHPETRIQIDGLTEILMQEGTTEQIEFVSPGVKFYMENYDAFLGIKSEYNTKSMTNIPPERLAKNRRANAEIMHKMMERATRGELSWCGTQFPTQSVAQEGSMSLAEYTQFVFEACLLNEANPIKAWEDIHQKQEHLASFLNKCSKLHFRSQDTDLKMLIKGRKWQNCDGKNNFPDGEIFTGPLEDSVEGHIRFSFPGIYMGKEIEDITLRFEQGKVVEAKAAKGEELLRTLLKTDTGASYVGEAAIGTNYGITYFTRNMLFDEKIGGTVHLALGNGYPDTGSKNKSAIHWDLLCDMRQGGEVYADDQLIYKDGNFMI